VALAVNPVADFKDLDQIEAAKKANIQGIHDPEPQVGGENIASATPIPALPYNDGGNTCGFLNDYDAVCPFTGSTSPDVVYRYNPPVDQEVTFSLCNSGYDTKIYVYENNSSTLVACNDDACGSDGFRSEVGCVPLTAGNTYYVVVDGYFGDCGDYDLSAFECVPCKGVTCPSGGLAEGEVTCFDGYHDTYNAGCNSTPPSFVNLPCTEGSLSVCGTYGGYFDPGSGFDYRDTDWYILDVPAGGASVTACVQGEGDTLMGYLDPVCPAFAFNQFVTPAECVVGCFGPVFLTEGQWYFFAGTLDFGSLAPPCGSDYVLTLDGLHCPVSVEESSWAEVKSKYRGQ
jgi:hypothetical protein